VSRISSGVNGRALRLNGSNYVQVPIDTTGSWFRF
jgi:hypothetical protein